MPPRAGRRLPDNLNAFPLMFMRLVNVPSQVLLSRCDAAKVSGQHLDDNGGERSARGVTVLKRKRHAGEAHGFERVKAKHNTAPTEYLDWAALAYVANPQPGSSSWMRRGSTRSAEFFVPDPLANGILARDRCGRCRQRLRRRLLGQARQVIIAGSRAVHRLAGTNLRGYA